MRRHAPLPLTLVLLVSIVCTSLAACGGDDGDSNATPGSDDESSDDSAGPLTLTSPAFEEGDPIPPEFSLGGGDVSPPLSWTGVAPETTELAITVVDPDAGNFVHWVVAGIDPALSAIEEGAVPAGAVQALNNFGEAAWGGPAPPPGAAHTYVFTLYALTDPSGIVEGAPANDAVASLERAGSDTAVLRATFEQR